MDMQTQLRISKHVTPPVTQANPTPSDVLITAVGKPEGVMIVIDDSMRNTVPWEFLEDMEALADAYAIMQVWQFRAVVELMGKMSRMRHVVMAP